MSTSITFIVPLRHPASSKNWENVTARLLETATSLRNTCDHFPDCKAILVANDCAELPELPDCFQVARVALAPPSVSVFRGETPEPERSKAVKWDKGYKVATGSILAKANGANYIMAVDADDLISKNVPQLVHQQPGAFGWYINQGWLLPLQSSWGVILTDFHNWCGTYALVRTDLLPLTKTVDKMEPETIRSLFGHHRDLIPTLKKKGTPLQPVNYPAAVYRIAHPDGNFGRSKLFSDALAPSKFFKRPLHYLKRLSKLRHFGRSASFEFYGAPLP